MDIHSNDWMNEALTGQYGRDMFKLFSRAKNILAVSSGMPLDERVGGQGVMDRVIKSVVHRSYQLTRDYEARVDIGIGPRGSTLYDLVDYFIEQEPLLMGSGVSWMRQAADLYSANWGNLVGIAFQGRDAVLENPLRVNGGF
jgi:hypothetical protein